MATPCYLPPNIRSNRDVTRVVNCPPDGLLSGCFNVQYYSVSWKFSVQLFTAGIKTWGELQLLWLTVALRGMLPVQPRRTMLEWFSSSVLSVLPWWKWVGFWERKWDFDHFNKRYIFRTDRFDTSNTCKSKGSLVTAQSPNVQLNSRSTWGNRIMYKRRLDDVPKSTECTNYRRSTWRCQ